MNLRRADGGEHNQRIRRSRAEVNTNLIRTALGKLTRQEITVVNFLAEVSHCADNLMDDVLRGGVEDGVGEEAVDIEWMLPVAAEVEVSNAQKASDVFLDVFEMAENGDAVARAAPEEAIPRASQALPAKRRASVVYADAGGYFYHAEKVKGNRSEPVLGHRPSQTGLDMSLNWQTVCQTSVPYAVSSHAFSQ
ncbi:hypothetical protein LSTR_LSTR004818 [Laodelphax striatellus]|uniref:Uncharacterized protein n=1 Tax=Laodelphax striatellus TaxID=195883 RepID=A0A482WIQ5_LAOST|nr:hypothetical protein LSTR_LSTR004818 [Laodelphax striatellus]